VLQVAILLPMAALPYWWPAKASWAEFLTSPGFAGVMAVVAASIAGFFVSRQLRQARRQHADERWWESLKWTYEIISGGESRSTQLGPDVPVSLLLALQQEATGKHGTQLQRSTIGALAAVLSTTPEASLMPPAGRNEPDSEILPIQEDSPGEKVVTRPARDTDAGVVESTDDWQLSVGRVTVSPGASDHLRSLLENAKEASPQARARLLEMAVHDALVNAAPSAHVIRPSGPDLGFDLGITTPDGPVAIEVKAWQQVPPIGAILNTATRLSDAVRASGLAGGVLVIHGPYEGRNALRFAELEATLPENVVVLFWRDQDGTTLYEAVQRAARNGRSAATALSP
jgi:hypothetical protein